MYLFNTTNRLITNAVYDATYEFMMDVYGGVDMLEYKYTEEPEGNVSTDFLHILECYMSTEELDLCMRHFQIAQEQFYNCIDLIDKRVAKENEVPLMHRQPYRKVIGDYNDR